MIVGDGILLLRFVLSECVFPVKFYNPWKNLDLIKPTQIEGVDGKRVLVCEDFNAHNGEEYER